MSLAGAMAVQQWGGQELLSGWVYSLTFPAPEDILKGIEAGIM